MKVTFVHDWIVVTCYCLNDGCEGEVSSLNDVVQGYRLCQVCTIVQTRQMWTERSLDGKRQSNNERTKPDLNEKKKNNCYSYTGVYTEWQTSWNIRATKRTNNKNTNYCNKWDIRKKAKRQLCKTLLSYIPISLLSTDIRQVETHSIIDVLVKTKFIVND